MEGTMGNEGINLLAGVMQGRMKKVSDSPAVLDIGQIGADMSLTTNQFPKPIPQTDYLVCRQLTLGKKDDKLTTTLVDKAGNPLDGDHKSHTSSEDYGKHKHTVIIPEKMRSIKAGDRVLVAWVGDDAVVIDIILPATSV